MEEIFMIKNQQEKNCKNCKHYEQHYVKFKYNYKAIDYGHCHCDRFYKGKCLKLYNSLHCCDLWELKERTEESGAGKIILQISALLKQLERRINKK